MNGCGFTTLCASATPGAGCVCWKGMTVDSAMKTGVHLEVFTWGEKGVSGSTTHRVCGTECVTQRERERERRSRNAPGRGSSLAAWTIELILCFAAKDLFVD